MKPAAIAVLALFAVPLAAGAAHACGMEVPIVGTPAERVARAWKYMDQKLPGPAVDQASSVVRDRKADPSLRAQADLILGWVQWKTGDRESARAQLEKARKLDPKALELVRSQHAAACYWVTANQGVLALLEKPSK